LPFAPPSSAVSRRAALRKIAEEGQAIHDRWHVEFANSPAARMTTTVTESTSTTRPAESWPRERPSSLHPSLPPSRFSLPSAGHLLFGVVEPETSEWREGNFTGFARFPVGQQNLSPKPLTGTTLTPRKRSSGLTTSRSTLNFCHLEGHSKIQLF